MLDLNIATSINNSRAGLQYSSGTFFKHLYVANGKEPYYNVRISGFCARDLRIANSNEFETLSGSFQKYWGVRLQDMYAIKIVNDRVTFYLSKEDYEGDGGRSEKIQAWQVSISGAASYGNPQIDLLKDYQMSKEIKVDRPTVPDVPKTTTGVFFPPYDDSVLFLGHKLAGSEFRLACNQDYLLADKCYCVVIGQEMIQLYKSDIHNDCKIWATAEYLYSDVKTDNDGNKWKYFIPASERSQYSYNNTSDTPDKSEGASATNQTIPKVQEKVITDNRNCVVKSFIDQYQSSSGRYTEIKLDDKDLRFSKWWVTSSLERDSFSVRDWRVITEKELINRNGLEDCHKAIKPILGVRLCVFKSMRISVIGEFVELLTHTNDKYRVLYCDLVFERELTRSGESHVGTFTADSIKGHDKDVKYKGRLLSQWRFKTRAELGELASPWLGNKQWQVFGRKLSDFAHIVIDYDDSIVGYVDFDKDAHVGAFRFSSTANSYDRQTYLVPCSSVDNSILESDSNLTTANPITTTTKPVKPKMNQPDNAYNLHMIICYNMSQASRVAERILPFTIKASSSSAGSAAVPIKYIDKYGNSCKPAHDSFKEFDCSEGDLYYVWVHKLSEEVIKCTGYLYDSTVVISRTRKKAMLNKKTHNVQNIPHLTMTYEEYKSKFESLYYKSEPAPQVTVTQSIPVTPVIRTDSKVNRFDELVSLRDGSEFSKFLNKYLGFDVYDSGSIIYTLSDEDLHKLHVVYNTHKHSTQNSQNPAQDELSESIRTKTPVTDNNASKAKSEVTDTIKKAEELGVLAYEAIDTKKNKLPKPKSNIPDDIDNW